MKNYEKPIVLANSELSEGVYAASGADCYTVTYNMHQTPQEGRVDYRIQLNATHAASDNHHSGKQTLVMSFNQPVDYSSSNGTLIGARNSSAITIEYNYHNNGGDSIGLGDLVVKSDPGLAITGAVLYCNHDCGQH